MNVLIFEDDADICQLYAIWIQEYNYHYVIAKSVEDGLFKYGESLQNLSNLNFDLVIIDYDLSQSSSNKTKNGLNVAREVLSLNKNQRIIFASAWPQKIFNEYIKTLKCFIEILQKPFEKDIFIRMIQDTFVYDTLKKVVVNVKENYTNPNSVDSTSYIHLFELLRKLQNDTFCMGNN